MVDLYSIVFSKHSIVLIFTIGLKLKSGFDPPPKLPLLIYKLPNISVPYLYTAGYNIFPKMVYMPFLKVDTETLY